MLNETSLTIEGIRTVIDSGQVRVLRFKPSVGLDRLQLEPICQSSATKRAGRAGRLESGLCLRLWDEKLHRAKPTHLEPEVRKLFPHISSDGRKFEIVSKQSKAISELLEQYRETFVGSKSETAHGDPLSKGSRTASDSERILTPHADPLG